jgi:hypothetical protein
MYRRQTLPNRVTSELPVTGPEHTASVTRVSFLAHCSLAYSHLACLGMGMYGSASFLGAKECGIVGPEEPMFVAAWRATRLG